MNQSKLRWKQLEKVDSCNSFETIPRSEKLAGPAPRGEEVDNNRLLAFDDKFVELLLILDCE